MSAEPVVLVPYGSDPLETLAALMLERHRRELPDLSRHAVLLPNPGVIARLHRILLAAASRAGHGGLLAPWCGTLDMWLQQSNDDATVVEEPERDLLLLEALAPFPQLRERYGIWALVDSLRTLFDELNAHHPDILDLDQLTSNLATGYGAPAPLAPLHGEAQLVHTLWNAWNAHLRDHRLQDRALQRRAALAKADLGGAQPFHIYIVGNVDPSGAEVDWLQSRLSSCHTAIILHGGVRSAGYHPDGAIRRCFEKLRVPSPTPSVSPDAYARFIEAVHADGGDIGMRARTFAADNVESPLRNRLSTFIAADFEQEARGVELAVRRWYARGVTNVGIVTPDRKLARRVRALLERANIDMRHAAGWALSTTSAATAVMRWIECVEQDFAQAPLLDFLKSPFVTFNLARTELEASVHHLEERIIRRYNIGAGLERYRRALRTFARSDVASGAVDESLATLLDNLAAAAEPLLKRLDARRRSVLDFLSALHTSIERTGMNTALNADAAGRQLLIALRPRAVAIETGGPRLTWIEFRHWLQRELERRRFRPPLPARGVELLDLAESRCRRFDALIIAGCTRDNLPGAPGNSPFFNDGVRRQLGLPTREERLLAPLHDFRRLLEAAPQVLLTWRRTENGEEAIPSPWTERLVAFHRLAYGTAAEDAELRALLAKNETLLFRRDAPLPVPATVPAPRLPPSQLPDAMSASSHQRLLDCPYQFYVADGLGLRSLDEVRDEMEKADYGQHVHRILHAFHTGVSGLPGPWTGGPISPVNRAQATTLLYELGRCVFGHDADKRLSTRGWRNRWERFVAVYLDWQEKRGRDWQVIGTEQNFERELSIGDRTLVLKGRADRLDRGPHGLAIVDYKTGAVPDAVDVATGEKAQLPFYALLHPDAITEVVYAQLSQDSIKTNVSEKGEDLARLVGMLEARLRTLIADIDRGAALPAWGDAQTCRFCQYEGICRREMWDAGQ